MSSTCDHCHRPFAASIDAWESSPAAVCATDIACDADVLRDCAAARTRWLEAEVARLTAELAEARKPRWEGRVLIVTRPVATATVYCDHSGAWGVDRCTGAGSWVPHGRGYATKAEAKAAAELAFGVETDDGKS